MKMVNDIVHRDPQEIADSLLNTAIKVSQDKSAVTPYALTSQKEDNKRWHHSGGKPDDITIVVGVIDSKYT